MNVVTNNDDKCEEVLNALKDVYDPEIGLNVVDLGLVYRINFSEEEHTVVVVMTLTSQFCPMGEAITGDILQSVSSVFKDYYVNIDLVFDPPWNFKMITDEGRRFLQGY